MAIIGEPQKVWELPAPLEVPQEFPLETHEVDSPPVEVPQEETVEV